MTTAEIAEVVARLRAEATAQNDVLAAKEISIGAKSELVALCMFMGSAADLIERLDAARVEAERLAKDWMRSYEYVTAILPLDPQNRARDTACPMLVAEIDRDLLDRLIGRAESAERERDALRARIAEAPRGEVMYYAETVALDDPNAANMRHGQLVAIVPIPE